MAESISVVSLVGARALLKVSPPRGGYGNPPIEEYRMLEVSPSGNWVRLMNA